MIWESKYQSKACDDAPQAVWKPDLKRKKKVIVDRSLEMLRVGTMMNHDTHFKQQAALLL